MARSSESSSPAIYVSSSRYERRHLDEALAESRTVSTAGNRVVIVCNESGKRLSEDELIATKPANCVGIIAGLEPLSARVLAHYRELKVISRLGTGMDSVDLDAAHKYGVSVLGTPDATTDAVAELTLGLMLASLRGIATSDRSMRSKKWSPVMGGLIKGRTVGIVGFGRIGRRVAELVEAFGAKVVFYDPFAQGKDSRGVTLRELLDASDIVTLHTPLNDDTRGMLGASEIAGLKRDCIVVNVARGGLIDEPALAEAVHAGRIKAAVDCFVEEPYTGALCDEPDAVLTAHMGSLTAETRTLMEVTAARQLVAELHKHRVL
ncbi:MAG: NAD(P)-dependent oxidoreductase [Ilumatobacteraceae bacterium]|jgi:D-3-phosphoglycerate dehydrogenase